MDRAWLRLSVPKSVVTLPSAPNEAIEAAVRVEAGEREVEARATAPVPGGVPSGEDSPLESIATELAKVPNTPEVPSASCRRLKMMGRGLHPRS